MMTCSFSLPSDHGRTGRERPRPCAFPPPSILRDHQDRHGGLHLSVHQNIPEQNLPCVPGQKEAQEKCKELIRAQCDSVAGSETPVRGQRGEGLRRRTRRRRRRRRRGRDKSSESSLFLCLLSALFPAVIVAIIFSAHGSVNCGFRAMGQFKLGAALF